MEDIVNHPKHYTQIDGIECIDVAEKFGYCLGNAIKYIWRCYTKNENLEGTITDLEKAIWYLKREIKTVELAREQYLDQVNSTSSDPRFSVKFADKAEIIKPCGLTAK